MDDYIVLALDVAGNEKTATICTGIDEARKYAKYYSSIGHHVKTMMHEEYIRQQEETFQALLETCDN